MPTAEELIKMLNESSVDTYASEPEELVIDAESRSINIPQSERLFGVKGDMNIERKYFRCPKIVGDNIDLSTHQIFIAYVYTERETGSILPSVGVAPYHCEDVEVDGEDITFSWKLTGNVFKNPGFILFKMYAKKTETDPNTVFNTTPAIGTVLATIPDGTEEIVEEYPDVIAQIFDRLDALESGGSGGTGGTTNYENLSNKPQLNGVTLEGNKTLDQVGVLAKNQGASNSGKYLSVGSDGNVVPADAPSGGTVDPEQIKQAVNGYLEENPVSGMTAEQEQQLNQNTTDVTDLKSAIKELQGLTSEQITALDDMFKVCAFTVNPSTQYTAFCDAFGIENPGGVQPPATDPPTGTTYNIKKILNGCSSSSSVTTVNEGSSYMDTLIPSEGYSLPSNAMGGEISIKMGDIDITSNVYNYKNGVINISSVTGNITITAVCPQEALLPQEALDDYFDFRNANQDKLGSYVSYNASNGNGVIFGNSNENIVTDEKGLKYARYTYSSNGTASWNDYPIPFTFASLTYTIGYLGASPYMPNNMVTMANNHWYLSPYYVNTDGTTIQLERIEQNNLSEGYHTLFITCDEYELNFYIDNVLAKTYKASEYSDFSSWKSFQNILCTQYSEDHATAFATWSKCLSLYELHEVERFFNTLEVE